jgi:hypothetical protein
MNLLSPLFPELHSCQSPSLVYPLTQQSYLFLVGGPKVQLFVDHGFNALDQFNVILCDKCYRFPGTPSASCAADPVDIIFRMCRDIKVDDDVDCWNVETTGRVPALSVTPHPPHVQGPTG